MIGYGRISEKMTDFNLVKTQLEGAYLISPFCIGDNRGGFVKIFEHQIYSEAGINFQLSETFASVSAKNVIRGMHFQLNRPQAKLVSVLKGSVYDIIVDLNMKSRTYKMWQGFELSEENHNVLYVPRGFAHGFMSMSDGACMLYQCDGKYDKETDTGIRYDDRDLNIIWPTDCIDNCIHSQRDLELMTLSEYEQNPMRL